MHFKRKKTDFVSYFFKHRSLWSVVNINPLLHCGALSVLQKRQRCRIWVPLVQWISTMQFTQRS